MFTRITQLVIVLVAVVMFVAFDSGSSLHGQPNNGDGESEWEQALGNSVTGVLGMYELVVNTSDETIGLQSIETQYEKEGCIVSNLTFFTLGPCNDCFTLPEEAISFLADTIELNFHIKHPIELGDDGDPPSLSNRKDLDIFDLALAIVPEGYPIIEFPIAGVSAYHDAILNPDGFTRDLVNVIENPTALPYVLVVDDEESGVTDNHNKFAMGSQEEVEVVFSKYLDGEQTYHVYLIAGIGVGVENENYLNPKYYNPEFNRKAPWKVRVSPVSYSGPTPDVLSLWREDSPYIEQLVAVEVFDWQIDAKVYEGDDFADAEPDEICTASGIFSVSIEIPGMNSILPTVSGRCAGGRGTPDDPRVFLVPVANENNLSAGNYTGLAIVKDKRNPADSSAENRDILIERTDEYEVTKNEITEYVTYMPFSVIISEPAISACNAISGGIKSITINGHIISPPPTTIVIRDGDTVTFNVMAISAGGSGGIDRIEADYEYIPPCIPDDICLCDPAQTTGIYECTFTNKYTIDPIRATKKSTSVVFSAVDRCSPETTTVIARIAIEIVENPIS